MHITQKHASHSTSFEFETDTLAYTQSDSYGSHSFKVPYGSIGMEPRFSMEKNGALFNGGILLLAWGLFQALHATFNGDVLGILFLLPGPICIVLHTLSKTAITYLNSDAGEIALLHDKHYDTVMGEIRKRRKKQLLEWHGNINFANDPEEEIQKFHWLHSQHLITDDQLQRVVTAIRNADTREDGIEEPAPPRQ